MQPKPCEGFEKCPFDGFHAPNGETFAFGCSLCREENAIVENLDEKKIEYNQRWLSKVLDLSFRLST